MLDDLTWLTRALVSPSDVAGNNGIGQEAEHVGWWALKTFKQLDSYIFT